MSEPKPEIDPRPLSPFTPSAGERNRDPILQAFKTFFPETGDALELASGSGAHINYFAPHFPGIAFQPSDRDPTVFETIKSNTARAGNKNVGDPLRIDLTEPDTWPQQGGRLYDVIFAINVFHLASVSAADGLAQIAARVLKPGGYIAVYGPFKVDGSCTTPSNEAFDRSLHASAVPGWGLKDVRDLERAAHNRGIALTQQLALPANNLMLVFRKPSGATCDV